MEAVRACKLCGEMGGEEVPLHEERDLGDSEPEPSEPRLSTPPSSLCQSNRELSVDTQAIHCQTFFIFAFRAHGTVPSMSV